MTINYLILVHDHFDHLNNLIHAIDGEGVNIYVHVDKKQTRNYTNPAPNVYVVKNPVRVNWGCFSMVEATLLLMKEAAKKTPADYYILLSGADYPIRSNSGISKVLQSKKEFIELKPAPFPRKPMSRFVYYHTEYDRRKKNIIWFFFRSAEEILRRLRIKRPVPFKIYAGAQWFALTRECVNYMLNTIKTNTTYINFFRYSKIPDEAFFQTLVGNSAFIDNVADTLTFTHWEKKNSPLYLEEKHLDVFMELKKYDKEPKVFARKFDRRNQHLLPEIDRLMRNGI